MDVYTFVVAAVIILSFVIYGNVLHVLICVILTFASKCCPVRVCGLICVN